jgi:hypothetical protein
MGSQGDELDLPEAFQTHKLPSCVSQRSSRCHPQVVLSGAQLLFKIIVLVVLGSWLFATIHRILDAYGMTDGNPRQDSIGAMNIITLLNLSHVRFSVATT